LGGDCRIATRKLLRVVGSIFAMGGLGHDDGVLHQILLGLCKLIVALFGLIHIYSVTARLALGFELDTGTRQTLLHTRRFATLLNSFCQS